MLHTDGCPIATDRLITSNMGYVAVQALYQGRRIHVLKWFRYRPAWKVKNESTDAQLELIRAWAI